MKRYEAVDSINMQTLVAIHNILKVFDDQMDNDEFDYSLLSAKKLKISENRKSKIFKMLSDAHYLSGIDIRENNDGTTDIDYENSCITLEGLKYYAENARFLMAMNAIPQP